MKIHIESTEEIVELAPGFRARAWQGISESGKRCIVFVAALGVPDGPGWQECQLELNELPNPGRKADFFMARMLAAKMTLEHLAISLFAAHAKGESPSLDDAEERWGHLEPEQREAWRMTADLALMLAPQVDLRKGART